MSGTDFIGRGPAQGFGLRGFLLAHGAFHLVGLDACFYVSERDKGIFLINADERAHRCRALDDHIVTSLQRTVFSHRFGCGLLGLLAARLIFRLQFLETCGRFGLLGIQALFEFVKLPAQFLGALLLGLLFAYLLDGTLNLGVAGAQDFFGLITCVMDNLPVLGADVVQPLVIVGYHLVEPLLLGPDILALVFPIAAVTHNVEQILIHVDVVTTHNFGSLVDNLLRQSRLACDLDGKRTARVSHRQLEQRLHALAVIEHRPVDHAVGLVGKVLQILVVGGHHAHHLMPVELLKNRLGNGTANLGLGTATHLVDEYQGLPATFRQEQFHVLQVAAIGTQVILNALLIADVNEDVVKQPHV